MSADEGSDYDDEIQDQEEIVMDVELDGEQKMDLEDEGVGEDKPRMKINQVDSSYLESGRPHLCHVYV